MVPKLHAKGRSFRGAATYLLHDKDRASTAHRVAWTETRNLATDDPDLAWRVMAATAMDAPRLKEQAGIKNTGRKSAESVLHLTLSWHPSETTGLGREEMMRAAAGALQALQAQDRQALVVCHSDERHPHIHVLVNRVSPEDGRMLSSSKEKLALSAWAERYEKDRGQILCEERVANNAAREQGEYTRGQANQPRHVHDLETGAPGDTGRRDQLLREQREKDRALARQGAEQAARRKEAWKALLDSHAQARKALEHRARTELKQSRWRLAGDYEPQWTALRQHHADQFKAFTEAERTMVGRARNVWQAVDLRTLFQSENRGQAFRQAVRVLASREARQEALRSTQEKETRALAARQRDEERRQEAEAKARRQAALAQERARFSEERQKLIQAHQQEAAAHRQAWKARRAEREHTLQQAGLRPEHEVGETQRIRDRLRQQREQRHHQRRDHHRGMGW